MRVLAAGDRAPEMIATALDGTKVRLPLAGTWTLLSFLRYASCPMCHLRVRELRLAREDFEHEQLGWFAVFHSPVSRLKRHMPEEVWAHVIPDAQRTLSDSYETRHSWTGLLLSVLVPSFWWRFIRAAALGYWGGAIDHSFHSMPADFVISPDGMIRAVHYGRHIGDHLTVASVMETARAPQGE